MHAHRVDVLDRADDHAVVGTVAHHLQLELLPPGDRLLDEDLADRTGRQPAGGEALELLGGRGDPGPPTAEDVGGTDDRRQPDLGDDVERLVHRVRAARRRHVEADADHRRLELLAVFCRGDRCGVSAEHFRCPGNTDDTSVVQLHGEVQPGLPAERRQHCIGPFAFDDRCQNRGRQRLDVGPVGEVRVGHDRRRVGVDEDDAVALLAEHAARLRSRVVELARLTDDDRARADDEDRREVVAPGGIRARPQPSVRRNARTDTHCRAVRVRPRDGAVRRRRWRGWRRAPRRPRR